MQKYTFTTTIGALTLAIASFGSPVSDAALAQEAATPAPVSPVQTIDIDPALWVVKDADTTIYLFGTVHFLRPGLGWFDEAVKTSFDAADELVVEIIDPDGPDAQIAVSKLAVDRRGTSLRDKLDAKDRTDYEKAMTDIGLPVEAFDQFEPWFAAITLGVLPVIKAGYDANSGADRVLLAAATESGKTLSELETVEYQLGLFDNAPEEGQIAYLNAVVDDIDQAVRQIDAMVDAWGKGDPGTLAKIMNDSFVDGRLKDALLVRRNAAWSRWIDERLKRPGTVFMAVGAGHMAGEGSVQEQLKLRNIATTRVDY